MTVMPFAVGRPLLGAHSCCGVVWAFWNLLADGFPWAMASSWTQLPGLFWLTPWCVRHWISSRGRHPGGSTRALCFVLLFAIRT